MRTIEELIQLFEDGKEKEITKEEWEAVDEIIKAYLNLMKSVSVVEKKIPDEEYKYPGMSYFELFIVAGTFIFLIWFFFMR